MYYTAKGSVSLAPFSCSGDNRDGESVVLTMIRPQAPLVLVRWRQAKFFEITKASGVPWRTEAAMWAVAMLEKGDLDGDAARKRILRAVGELQGTAPKSGEAVH
jgi:hypothetical protein